MQIEIEVPSAPPGAYQAELILVRNQGAATRSVPADPGGRRGAFRDHYPEAGWPAINRQEHYGLSQSAVLLRLFDQRAERNRKLVH